MFKREEKNVVEIIDNNSFIEQKPDKIQGYEVNEIENIDRPLELSDYIEV